MATGSEARLQESAQLLSVEVSPLTAEKQGSVPWQ